MVSAWSSEKVFNAVNPVVLDTVEANIGNMWDNTTDAHKFTMEKGKGIFYVALVSAANPSSAVDFVLQKSNMPFASCNQLDSSLMKLDPVGRDVILNVKSSETLHFSSNTGFSSNPIGYTNIAIFNIASLSTVFFSVARNSILSAFANPVTFNKILVNDNFHFNVSTNKFTAPSSGVYYFTFTVGVEAHQPAEFLLYVNDEPFTSITRQYTDHAGTDVIGRSIMMNLNASDTVHVVNKNSKVAWSSDLLETSFAGFKYEPTQSNKVRNNLCTRLHEIITVQDQALVAICYLPFS